MATRTTQHGASASRRRTASGARSSRARTSGARNQRAAGRTSVRAYAIPLAIIAVIVLAAWSFYPVARLQYMEQREAARLEAELDGLKARNADLRAQVERLKTPEGVEEVARESLGLVKEGENLVVVVDGDEEERPVVTEPNTACIPEAEPSMWQQVLDTVFGLE